MLRSIKGRLSISRSLVGRRLEKYGLEPLKPCLDRKSTRLNSSHRTTSYAVFCLKKKIHSRSEIRVERRDGVAELAQQITELSLLIAFVHVSVPAADVCESNLQTHARFD